MLWLNQVNLVLLLNVPKRAADTSGVQQQIASVPEFALKLLWYYG
jgi:hypothetical protein